MSRTAILAALLLAGCARESAPEPAGNGAAQRAPKQPEAGTAPVAPEDPAPAPSAPDAASPCLTQNGRPVPENRIKATGTEPFWAAVVEGRCVTYMTPENQSGVRIWTLFEGTSENGQWSGALDRQPFVMTTRPERGCSDGMSDKAYPIAVTLEVRGERRTGCAEAR